MIAMNVKAILTKREFEVMVLVATGKYNKEIAIKLNCEETTIKKHLQHIFPKLEVQNRTEATIRYLNLVAFVQIQRVYHARDIQS
jgi:DNA-binding NarL/FixJ family response regulator